MNISKIVNIIYNPCTENYIDNDIVSVGIEYYDLL